MDMICYFYVSDGIIKALCIECHKNKKEGWFWPGGFGDEEIKCSVCNKIINAKKDTSSI
jgi:hypothetical protein